MMWELPAYKPRGVRCVLLDVVCRVRHQPASLADEDRNPAATFAPAPESVAAEPNELEDVETGEAK